MRVFLLGQDTKVDVLVILSNLALSQDSRHKRTIVSALQVSLLFFLEHVHVSSPPTLMLLFPVCFCPLDCYAV